jgi:chromosomal replication initiation ATPase DnaA
VCLVGEKGSGKTHLASIWGTRQHASIIDVSFDIVHEKLYDIISTEDQQRYFILDNADELEDDLMLFYIYNTVKSMNAYLLITAKSYPCNWNITLSDVKSRLSTISVIRIQKPNGETMLSIIEKMLERRGISAKKPIIEYIANRIERSYESINYWVKLIDNKLIDSGSTLSLGFIKTIL